jgi:Tol biopolymer transport system component
MSKLRLTACLATLALIVATVPAGPVAAAHRTIERVNFTSTGAEATGGHSTRAVVTPDGRFVAFQSDATNLVTGGTTGGEIFVRDRQTGTTTLASSTSAGVEGNGISTYPGISADGRYVVFLSGSTNLVPGDTNGAIDAFVKDRQTGAIERVSVSSAGEQANASASRTGISADGRYVVFGSTATNLVAGDTNAAGDVFVRDRQTGTTERVSVSSTGAQANGGSADGMISADGRFVIFASVATNLVDGDTNGLQDVFIRDRSAGTTERVSIPNSGGQATGGHSELGSENIGPRMSSDARYVVFQSDATNLVTGDTNGLKDIFVRDRTAGTTERISVSGTGTQADDESFTPSISCDGRYVVFDGAATNLVAGDTNNQGDVFLRDRQSGTLERLSVAADHTQSNGSFSLRASMSADGRYVVFDSGATNFVTGDTNARFDIFVVIGPATTVTCPTPPPPPTTGGSAPTEVSLPATTTGGSVTTTLPVQMPASGVVTTALTLVGSSASLSVPQGTVVTDASGRPFTGKLFPPSPRTDAAVASALAFSSSAGYGLRFTAAASAATVEASAAPSGPLTFSVPLDGAGASARVVSVDPTTGAITTFAGTLSADGTKLTFKTSGLGIFAAASVIDLGRAASAPSVVSELPVRFPGTAIGPAVTLAGSGGTLAIPAGTRATVASLNAPFFGTLAPPSSTSRTGVSSAATLTPNISDPVRFDRAATLTLPLPAGQENAALMPVAVSTGGSLACMSGTLSGSGIATEVTATSTYALLGAAKPAVASADRSSPTKSGYHSAWAGQSAPATLCPTQQVEVTVRLRNTGDLPWIKGTPSQVVLGSSGPPGNSRDFDRGILIAPLYNRDRFATHAEQTVRPGEVGTFTFTLRAPATAGTYPVHLRPLIEGQLWLEDEGIHFDVVVR